MTGIGESTTTSLLDVRMPKLSDSMEEATILEWLKQPGDRVVRGEPLVEVETDKATIVYEAEVTASWRSIVVQEGDVRGARRGDRAGHRRHAAPAPPAPPRCAAGASPARSRSPPPRRRRRSRRRARARARRHRSRDGSRERARVALENVAGTGPGGRIVRADVRRAAGQPTTQALNRAAQRRTPCAERSRSCRSRPRSGRSPSRMSESRAQVPDFTVEAEIDMEAAHRLREQWRTRGARPAAVLQRPRRQGGRAGPPGVTRG